VQEEFPLGLTAPRPADGHPLCWVLLVKVEPGLAHAELSVPAGMRDGLVVTWAERIPLPPLGTSVEADEEPAELDVPVELR
jgi:hypothetical protein